MNNNSKILVVEDDLNLGFLLAEFLEETGFQVKLCRDAKTALQAITRQKFDLCVLDIMMPFMDGFELAKKIKLSHKALPFLFLTAKSRKEDKLKGYELGAEDYILKPFEEQEFLCKIKVILRRNQKPATAPLPEQFQFGSFAFDYKLMELRQGETVARLTEKENEVLRLLCLHQNRILKREEAVERIYGKKDYFLGRSFDVFISKLRKRFQVDPSIKIENVFKVGFIFQVPEPKN